MKVGVLSMQDVPNYGSLMQAFALKQLLLSNGADEVYFIDIEPGKKLLSHTWIYKLRKLTYYIFTMQIFSWIRLKKYAKKTVALFDEFHSILGDKNYQDTKDMDMVVIGSDEVFNCCQYSAWGYTLQLYGKVSCPYVISYAGSFGHTSIEDLHFYGIAQEIGKTMQTMKHISVRDDNSFSIVEAISGITPYIHLDPVLIYGFKSEIAAQNNRLDEKYILIYSYNGRINNLREIQAIKNFARKRKKKLFSLFCEYSWCDGELHPQTPMELFSYFKYADYVITDTFHGSIFSIITHRNFCALVRNSNKNKLYSLLEMLDLECRLIVDVDKIDYVLNNEIDYLAVEEKLSKKRVEANDYLRANMLKVQEFLE